MKFILALVSTFFVLAVNLVVFVVCLYAMRMGYKYHKMHTGWELVAECLSPFGTKSVKDFFAKLLRVIVLVIPALAIKLVITGASWAINVGAKLATAFLSNTNPSNADTHSKSE